MGKKKHINNNRKTGLMTKRIFLIFIRHSAPMFLTLAILGFGAVLVTTRFLTQNRQETAMKELTQIKAYYEVILEEMDSLNIMFTTNPDIVNRLKSLLETDNWTFRDTRDIRTIRSYISAPANARPYIDSIYIYQNNSRRKLLSSNSGVILLQNMNDQAWYESYRNHSPSIGIWAESRKIAMIQDQKSMLTIYRGIYNGLGERTGVMVLNLLEKKLINNYSDGFAVPGQFIHISDGEGNRLLTLGRQETGKRSETVHFSLISPRFGWIYDMGIPKKELYKLSRTLTLLTIAISLLALITGFILTYEANKKERNFIQKTLDLLEKARGQKMETEIKHWSGNLFDYMTSHILQTFLEQDYLKVQKEAMEYKALQMQINPHFLFNTLETINWRAIKLSDGPNDVSLMISLMSKILKYAMDVNIEGSVTMEEEIRHTQYYIQLQSIRFPDKFRMDWKIDKTLLKYNVPRLLFQPLLENCLNHGFKEDETLLSILIEAIVKEDCIQLTISDNGRGMDSEGKEQAGSNPSEQDPTHIGLDNVRKRINLFFKGQVEMEVESSKGKGMKISFILPLHMNSKQKEKSGEAVTIINQMNNSPVLPL